MSLVKARSSFYLDVDAALYAIGATGLGRCWHCDRKLPPAEEAIRAGWHVARVEGDRVANIILVCPQCRRQHAKVGEERVLRNLPPPVCDAVH